MFLAARSLWMICGREKVEAQILPTTVLSKQLYILLAKVLILGVAQSPQSETLEDLRCSMKSVIISLYHIYKMAFHTTQCAKGTAMHRF